MRKSYAVIIDTNLDQIAASVAAVANRAIVTVVTGRAIVTDRTVIATSIVPIMI